MSLGGGASTALDNAVTKSIAAGVTYAIAAGNGNGAGVPQDACKSSPARVPAALTVGASDKHRRGGLVQQLRQVRRPVRPGREHHQRLVHVPRGDEHDQRDVDGDPARDRRRGALPAGQPDGDPPAVSSAIKAADHAGTSSATTRTANNDLLFSSY